MAKKCLSRVFTRIIFSTLLILITISAHRMYGDIFSLMYSMGLDVPMTPFTADMTLMLTKEKKDPYYQRNYHVIYRTTKGRFRIEGEKLGWYEFKAPFQWMIGCSENSSDCPVGVYYLCRSLEDYTQTIVLSWAVFENTPVPQDENGFGKEILCPLK